MDLQSHLKTSLACKFCFLNTDHVLFLGEFSFRLFIIYAYICTFRECEISLRETATFSHSAGDQR